jgi:predicted dehydrogenase
MLKIGLIGAGLMGQVHARAYANLPQASRVAVADVRAEKANEVASYTGAQVFATMDELLASVDVDVIDICLPTPFHAAHTIRALEADKHVFCEKPVTRTMDEARQVVSAVRKAKGKFTGAEFADVYAEAGMLFHDLGIDDSGLLSFSLTDGTICTLDCSWSRRLHYPTWSGVTLNTVGADGYVSIDAFAQTLAVYTEEPRATWVHWGSDMDYLMIQDFARRVSRGEKPAITGEDGLRAVELALGAYRSAETHQLVKLPLDE